VKFLRAHPVFFSILAAIVAVVAAEVWFLLGQRAKETELEARLDRQVLEIESLQRRVPGPSDQNLRAALDDLDQNKVVLTTMLRHLNVVGADELEYFEGEPATRTDAYFDIAQFVDRMRSAATEANVSLKEGENFGFSSYTNEGPEAGLIRPVYRQRRIVEYLLRALFAARPESLVAVQRELPVPVGGGVAQAPARDDLAARDFFVIDPQVSARTPGYVETTAFRIEFSGQTTALRGFMNALAAPEIPLVVRSVEVDNAPVAAGPRSNSSGSRSFNVFGRQNGEVPEQVAANVPIVANNEALFTVTVEMFEVNVE
jgi:hypothetical protein